MFECFYSELEGDLLEGGSGVHLQPVGDLGCVVRVGWYQHRLVPLCIARLVGDWGRQRRRLIVARHAEEDESRALSNEKSRVL